jgi:hypothetical protein
MIWLLCVCLHYRKMLYFRRPPLFSTVPRIPSEIALFPTAHHLGRRNKGRPPNGRYPAHTHAPNAHTHPTPPAQRAAAARGSPEPPPPLGAAARARRPWPAPPGGRRRLPAPGQRRPWPPGPPRLGPAPPKPEPPLAQAASLLAPGRRR